MTTAPRRFACTYTSHALTRSSPHSFERDTEPMGLMPDGAGGMLRLGRCRSCGSTLALAVAS